jgi:hypothetical protein
VLLHAAANIAFQFRRMANEQRVLRETFPGYGPGIRGLFGTRSDVYPGVRCPAVIWAQMMRVTGRAILGAETATAITLVFGLTQLIAALLGTLSTPRARIAAVAE